MLGDGCMTVRESGMLALASRHPTAIGPCFGDLDLMRADGRHRQLCRIGHRASDGLFGGGGGRENCGSGAAKQCNDCEYT